VKQGFEESTHSTTDNIASQAFPRSPNARRQGLGLRRTFETEVENSGLKQAVTAPKLFGLDVAGTVRVRGRLRGC
jgi:hypothetical protein